MKEIAEFAESITRALEWLEKAESELASFNEECEGQLPEVGISLSRFSIAYDALKALRGPLEQQIKAAQNDYAKEEARYGDGTQY